MLADASARSVVDGGMDSAPHPAQGTLVGGVHEGGPLQTDVGAGTFFKDQKLVHWRIPFGQPAWPICGARQELKQLRRSTGIGAVAADVSRKRRGHKARPLVRPPAFRQDPSYACLIDQRDFNEVRPLPATHLDFADLVFVVGKRQGICIVDHLDPSWNQWQARRMVVGQIWIGTLAMLGHVPDARDRA